MTKSHVGQFLSHLLNKQTDWNKWVGSMIEYKEYIGWFDFDEKTNLFLGRVSNIDTLITFQGRSVAKTKQAFKDAVNEYLGWCKKHGKEPERPSLKVSHGDVQIVYGPVDT